MTEDECVVGCLVLVQDQLGVVQDTRASDGRVWVWLAESKCYATVTAAELQQVTIVRGPPVGGIVAVKVE
jgi:hypothetical protein